MTTKTQEYDFTDNPGIDYSNGQSNFDTDTGIHFGVIHQNKCASHIWDDLEGVYVTRCPHCGTELGDGFDNGDEYENGTNCPHCEKEIGDGEQYGEEADYYKFDDGKLVVTVDDSGDLWVLKSPFYSLSQYCSPCAPGAGYLSNPCKEGIKTYCLPVEWFDDYSPCPYPIFDV